MQKYTLGVFITAASVGVIKGIEVGPVTGIAYGFAIMGSAYIVTGLIETLYRAAKNLKG